MITHLGFEEWRPESPTVASLGNYDGVHRGHQAILGAVVEDARKIGVQSVALTFDPVPKKVLSPDTAPPLIQTLQQRLECLAQCRLDRTIVVAFNQDFARLVPDEFVERILVGHLKIRELVVGENFAFGYRKQGNLALLREMGGKHGFSVRVISEVQVDGQRVSSTAIREMVKEGRMEEASRFLSRPFAVEGTVVRGEQLGGKLGIPTANIKPENEVLPANGVYVTVCLTNSKRYSSVTNVGLRPTVGGKKLTVETHLLDFDADLYDHKMELQFLAKLRDERRFSGIEELKAAIRSDIESTRAYFLSHS